MPSARLEPLRLADRWEQASAPPDALAQLLRRARLLGAEPTIALPGGGSSVSVKAPPRDGEPELLWIGAVGSDLATLARADLLGLRLADLLPLAGGPLMGNAALAGALARRRLAPQAGELPSEAMLHALVPASHVDLVHAEAIATLCNAVEGSRLTRACFGDEAAWVPASDSALVCAHRLGRVAVRPGVRFALVARRGLVVWGDSAHACYAATLEAVNRAAAFVHERAWAPPAGGQAFAPLDVRRRDALLARLLPVLRDALSSSRPKVLELDVSEPVVAFASAREAPLLAQAGPVVVEHVASTGRVPLWIDYDPAHDDVASLAERIVRAAARHRAQRRWEVSALGGSTAASSDLDPQVVLLAGLGMVTAGTSMTGARRTRDLYRHAIAVMTGASAIDRFVACTPAECDAFVLARRR